MTRRGIATCALAIALVNLGCGGGTEGSELTLETFCTEMAKRYCEQDRPCCEKAGFGFNAAKCQASYLEGCGNGVEAVKAARASFDSSKLAACVQQYQPFVDTCLLDPSERLRAVAETAACRQAFRGLVPVGGACKESVECAPGSDERLGWCGTAHVCEHRAPLQEGANCEDGFSQCAENLSCEFSTGKCVPDPDRHPVVFKAACGGP
jgi:hypothetical protein